MTRNHEGDFVPVLGSIVIQLCRPSDLEIDLAIAYNIQYIYHTDRQTNRQTYIHTDRTDRTDRQNRETDRQAEHAQDSSTDAALSSWRVRRVRDCHDRDCHDVMDRSKRTAVRPDEES
jgi:hypothetical protein